MSGLDSERIRWARYRRRGPPSIAQSRHTKGNDFLLADIRRPFAGGGRSLRLFPSASLPRKLALLLPLVVVLLFAFDDVCD